jgi:F-type H+-transporting ATPase subunit delta
MAIPRVAHRYAKSLIDLSSERSTVDAVQADLALIAATLKASDDLELLLKSPIIQGDKKWGILDKVFSGKLSEVTMAFIRILVEKGRESLLASVADAGLELVRRMKNIQVAEVVTASPLDDESRARIESEIRKLHSGGIELQERVDDAIIGGYILRLDDRMVDASTRRQLQLMRRELTEHEYEPEF